MQAQSEEDEMDDFLPTPPSPNQKKKLKKRKLEPQTQLTERQQLKLLKEATSGKF